MHKNKIRGVVLALAVTLGITTLTTGCSLVSVNPEKDKQQVIAEIDGQSMTIIWRIMTCITRQTEVLCPQDPN